MPADAWNSSDNIFPKRTGDTEIRDKGGSASGYRDGNISDSRLDEACEGGELHHR